MIDFMINVIIGAIVFYGIAYFTSKYKITNLIVFMLLNMSFAFRLMMMSTNVIYGILNVVYICGVYVFLYALISVIADLNIYGPIEKVNKVRKKSLITLNMLFIALFMFNFSNFSDYFLLLFFAIIILYVICGIQMIDYDDALKNATIHIKKQKCCTIKQIAEVPELSINKSLPNDNEKYYHILEGLEIASEKNNSILLIKDRTNIENTVLFDAKIYDTLKVCLETTLIDADVFDVVKATKIIKEKIDVQIHNEALASVINLDLKNFYCFNNKIISENLLNRIHNEIKENIDKDNYDITQIKDRYNMEAYTLSLIADFCGFSVKLEIA